jgi:hypothetical protein
VARSIRTLAFEITRSFVQLKIQQEVCAASGHFQRRIRAELAAELTTAMTAASSARLN